MRPLPAPRPVSGCAAPRVISVFLLATGCIVAEGDKSAELPPESTNFQGTDWDSEDDPMDDGDEPGEDGGEVDAEQPLITLSWGVNGFEFMVEGAPDGLWLGMVETGGPCVADSSCWTGEDCREGYTTGDQTFGPYCHPVVANAATVLLYDGDPSALPDGSTAFEPHAEGNTTYLLESREEDGGDGSCWVFGHDPTYYSAEGCSFATF